VFSVLSYLEHNYLGRAAIEGGLSCTVVVG